MVYGKFRDRRYENFVSIASTWTGSHTAQFPLRFREAENEKNVRGERIRETSRGIDEVAGAFGQDTLKWPRRWHRLLDPSSKTRPVVGFPLRCLYHVYAFVGSFSSSSYSSRSDFSSRTLYRRKFLLKFTTKGQFIIQWILSAFRWSGEKKTIPIFSPFILINVINIA